MGPVAFRLILAGVDSFIFQGNVARAHTLLSLAQCERNTNVPEVQGDSEVPHQMAWILRGQQASMCNAAQPVWLSANISLQLPLDVGYQVIFSISSGRVNTSGNFLPEMKCDLFVLSWQLLCFARRMSRANLFVKAGSQSVQPELQTHPEQQQQQKKEKKLAMVAACNDVAFLSDEYFIC